MIRELVLISADLRAAPWYASRVAPRPKIPDNITLRVLQRGEKIGYGPISSEVAAARLNEGDRCVVAEYLHAAVGQMWLSQHSRHLDWIGCKVAPQEDAALLYNAWVDESVRGPGIHWAMASLACETVVAMGLTRITAGVERGEFAPFARKYAEMGLAVIEPTGSLWCLRLFGLNLHITLAPPRDLINISAGLSCA